MLFHRKALDLDPKHRGTLEDLVELNLARGQFDEAIADLRALAETAPTADRVTLLERIGNLYRDKLGNSGRAMSAYVEALELDSANRRVLQRVLDLQSGAGQWKSVVETIGRFIDLENDRARRAAYYLASAEIRRTHLKDQAGALDCYETALDEMLREEPLRPQTRERALDTFHSLRELVTADANWKYLEQCYRRMLKRLPKDDPAHIPLWDALGEIYRGHLAHPQSAIEAFELAHSLDRDKSAHRARVLAELYVQTGANQPQQPSARVARLVAVDPMNGDSYRALGAAALAAGRTDEAWCVSRALVFLDQANREEKALYRRFQREETRKAKGILDEDAWSFLRHPDEDLVVSSIFSLIWQPIVALRAGPTKAFEIKPKERLDIEGSNGVVAKIFKHAARVLNVALPDVYVQPRRSGRLLLANCIEKGRLAPAVIVGRDLMTGYRDTEIASSVGAMLALMRPAYYLKLALASSDELEVALAAAMSVVGGVATSRPELAPAIATATAALQRGLTRSDAEALLRLVERVRQPIDVLRWRSAVDSAAQRAGLVISGDLGAATRMIASESTAIGGNRPSQRVQELVAYSVSPAYFTVRTHLGVTVA
jgi:tetratricopeptide (TPR) repeat protein